MSHPPDQTTRDAVHQQFMRQALDQARLSPPSATKYCVGALLVDADTGAVLSTGYSLELPPTRDDGGSSSTTTTHAEQCCLMKIAAAHGGIPEDRVGEVLPPRGAVLYTTMEPCSERLSGSRACADRILGLRGGAGGIRTVYVGIPEPKAFVADCCGMRRLREGGVEVVLVQGLEEEILQVSLAGHGQGG